MSDVKQYIIGIDPGLTGALAYFKLDEHDEPQLIGVRDMPIMANQHGKGKTVDCLALVDLMRPFEGKCKVVIIERVQAMPKDGAVGAFKFGKTAMAPEALCAAYLLPIHFIMPGVWKRVARLIGKPKGVSIARAKTQWPEHAELFRLKKHEGRAEAALIGYFGYKNYKSTEVSGGSETGHAEGQETSDQG